MKNQINEIRNYFIKVLKDVKTQESLNLLIDELLGKKGKLNEILKGLKDLSDSDKKEIGILANELKEFIKSESEKKEIEIEKINYSKIEEEEKIDPTLSFESKDLGHLHPISLTSKLLEDIFISLGFKVEDGPQIETEEFNFDKLNIPDNHPARDVWDTFWITDEINSIKKSGDKHLLRTHTSPVQIRTMLSKELPIKIIVPGRVFRYEQEDARHTCNFYQLEGLVVGEKVTFGDLKWTLDTVMKKLLGENTNLRFRPSIFPFTEPSAEIDVSCQLCAGSGCKMCSGTGWVELLGAGMVHPKVLSFCGIDPEKYSGFAFGMGIDRIAAQRYGVSSSRMFYQNKLKLNEQF
ncbi:MAG: phenylalanine--tRNA ligase subunit alpha [Candidatus Gracilibacteria bacterium]|nr:phenylalanine--tRNA ligase subunit alpha [Candidatus Gracilibacteria bacterium]